MPIATIADFVAGVIQSQLLDSGQCAELHRLKVGFRDVRSLAQELLKRDWLTAYQVNQIFQGKGAALTLGPYSLLERIGEGGMGQVFKARQTMLDRIVALKIIRKQCLDHPKVVQRFLREIRAAGKLNHPHIVRAYDADQVNETYFIAMEFIDGDDLAQLVKKQGPLPIDQACEYIRQAALGLQHAHERGLVHRDIKPANLLVTRAVASDRRSSGTIQRPANLPTASDQKEASGVRGVAAPCSSGLLARVESAQHYPWGIVKILDMGLARYTESSSSHDATNLTHVGAVMGTPEFIAPEQARDSHTSDIRADLYSLGCTLYFLLSGRAPFPKGSVTEKLLQHQLDEPEHVEQVRRETLLTRTGKKEPNATDEDWIQIPTPVESLLARLMSKHPEDRYQTPSELASALQSILQRLADGTLPRNAPAELIDTQTHVPLASPATPLETAEPSRAAGMHPLVQIRSQRVQPSRFTGKRAILLAALGGSAVVAILTAFAAAMLRA